MSIDNLYFTFDNNSCGGSSIGGMPPSQGGGCGFDSRPPLSLTENVSYIQSSSDGSVIY